MSLTLPSAAPRQRYVKRAAEVITAVQLRLDTDGFAYAKWGAQQHCKAGDWLVDNAGEIYTVAADSFRDTYREISPGRYVKPATVWAALATTAGSVTTREGSTTYRTGDYLVSNNADGNDIYAVASADFERMYERA